MPQAVKIRRIGLVLEMEDGSKVMVYADQLTHAEVTITRTLPDPIPWGDPRWNKRHAAPPVTSILIDGLESYRIQETAPDVKVSSAGRELEAMRRAVL
jgi:hypothetical protein